MNLNRTWLTGVLLGLAVLLAADRDLTAQTWQPNWQRSESEGVPADWQQRVLRQTQTSQPAQTTAVQRSAPVYESSMDYGRSGMNFVARSAPAYEPSVMAYRPAGGYRVAQRPTPERGVFDDTPAPAQPGTTGRPSGNWASDAEVIPTPGAMQFESAAAGGTFGGHGGCATCGGSGEACDIGGPCGGPACDECGDFGWPCFDGRCGPWIRGLSVFVGADGFKGPLDHGTNGNFGMNEGLNLARPLGDPWGCGYQIGANFVQSDFSGAPLVRDTGLRAAFRRQYFATAGIFRRAEPCGGFQWGVVYDYLHDIYYQSADLQQVRSETAYVIDDVYEVGYYGAYGVGTNRVVDGKLDPTDMFVFFARRNFENGGDGRLWFGATGNGDGLLGVDLWVPLGKGFALENRINYMIPKQGRGDVAQVRESWGLVAQLVWYPGQNAKCQQKNPYRPIFNVADNSLFMVDRLTNQ
jgi:hypothetical protein